jgi:hypothetical protein
MMPLPALSTMPRRESSLLLKESRRSFKLDQRRSRLLALGNSVYHMHTLLPLDQEDMRCSRIKVT